MPTTPPRPYDPLRKIRVMRNGLRLAMRDKAVAYKAVLATGLLVIAFAQRAWLDFGLVLAGIQLSATPGVDGCVVGLQNPCYS